MELWIPQSVDPTNVQTSLQTWLHVSNKYAYQNIIQDRVNSIYPNLAEHKILYILNISADRIIQLSLSPLVAPEHTVPVKQCAICHEEDSVVRHTLRCNHTFHVHCIDRWLRDRNTCPLCRTKIY